MRLVFVKMPSYREDTSEGWTHKEFCVVKLVNGTVVTGGGGGSAVHV